MALATPATALWNQRAVVASRQDDLRQLIVAVGRPTDLCLHQWTQLMAFALEFQPDVILELGRGFGNSTCCFLETAALLGHVKPCKVVSLSLDEHWQQRTVPRLQKLRPPEWFARGEMLQQDIMRYDAAPMLHGAQRCFVFWDAHGFAVAEWVLGHLLPQLAGRAHAVAMHDMSDRRFCTPPRDYRDCGMWKGENGEEAGFSFGHIFSRVSQAISAVDFAARNQMPLHSADESYFAELGDSPKKFAELKQLFGADGFSLNGHWFWFTLDEAREELTFPSFSLAVPKRPPLWKRAIGRGRQYARQAMNRLLALGGALTPARQLAAAPPAARRAIADSGVAETALDGFDAPEALAIAEARLDHLEGLGLDLHGRRLLAVGGGANPLGSFFAERGCQVVCVDGPEGRGCELPQRHARLTVHAADVERDDLGRFGCFDAVLCYGLLHHLENPLAALRILSRACAGLLLVESAVADHPDPVLVAVEEPSSPHHSLRRLGCRPSPAYLVKALQLVGFPWVYAPLQPPAHPDFDFSPEHNLEHRRDGRLLRSMLVASRQPLTNDKLRLLTEADRPTEHVCKRSEQPWTALPVS